MKLFSNFSNDLMLLFLKREEYTNDNTSLCLGHCDPLKREISFVLR